MASLVETIAGANSGLSKSWEVSRKHTGAYSGGCAEISSDGITLACLYNGDVSFLNIDNGQVEKSLMKGTDNNFDDEIEEIVCFALHPSKNEIVTASRNLLLRHWVIGDKKCKRSIRAHDEVVLSMSYDRTGTLCATGSADRTVKVWDIEKGYCTHNFIGHTSIVSSVVFHRDPKRLLLASASEDCTVRLWDLSYSKCVAVLKDHLSVPRGIEFMMDGWTLVTAGRDQVLNIWNLEDFSLLLTVTVFDPIEGAVALDIDSVKGLDDSIFNESLSSKKNKGKASRHEGLVAVAGQKGIVYLYHFKPKEKIKGDAKSVGADKDKLVCRCILKVTTPVLPHLSRLPSGEDPKPVGYTSLLYRKMKDDSCHELVAVTEDHNFKFFQANQGFKHSKLIVGYNDVIVDIKTIPPDNSNVRRVAVATNSSQVRIFDADSFSASLLDGHGDTVLALDVSPNGRYLTTVSKDQTGMIWDLLGPIGGPIALLKGHTGAVGAVCMSNKIGPYSSKSGAFVVTGSVDKTVKRYELNGVELATLKDTHGDNELVTLRPKFSIAAHSKDINSIAISPNDALIATASQDKTIKLWRSFDLSLTGTLTGHKRGVWNVVFSPVDKMVATCSSDRTIRLWSITNFSCLKTFQGHTAGVLNCLFVSGGAQLLSGGADGLLKLWTIKTSECEGTFDGHTDRVWAMSAIQKVNMPSDSREIVNGDFEILTGGGDSVINIWRDNTTEHHQAVIQQKEEDILKDQTLANSLRDKDYKRAAALAFELNKPQRLVKVLKDMLSDAEKNQLLFEPDLTYESDEEFYTRNSSGDAGRECMEDLVKHWENDQIKTCLSYCRDWNTSAKTYFIAQAVIEALFRCFGLEKLSKVEACGELVEGLIPYSDRHYQRLDRLLQSTYLVDYTLASMRMLLPTESKTEIGDIYESSDSDQVQIKKFIDGKVVFNVVPMRTGSEESDATDEEKSDLAINIDNPGARLTSSIGLEENEIEQFEDKLIVNGKKREKAEFQIGTLSKPTRKKKKNSK